MGVIRMSNKQLSFVVDQETIDLINTLKKELKAPTAAAVFRKSLAIAKIAAEQARDDNGVVRIRGKSKNAEDEISLALTA